MRASLTRSLVMPHMGLVLVMSAACSSRAVTPSHATASDDVDLEVASAGGDSPLANDFVRTTLREIHDGCAEYVTGLEEDVDDAATREDVGRVIAAAAYVVGEIADGSDDAEVMGRTGAAARSCNETPNDYGCGVTPLPSTYAGRESPLHLDTVSARLTTSDRIHDLNDALDALDDFVFSHSDPARWSATDEASWVHLRDAASHACELPAPSPTP